MDIKTGKVELAWEFGTLEAHVAIPGAVLTVSALSTEWLGVNVVAVKSETGEHIDPTPGVVRFAFTALDQDPTGGSAWVNGSWDADLVHSPPAYRARVLVGPLGMPLAVGAYDVWARVTSSFEDSMATVGTLVVT